MKIKSMFLSYVIYLLSNTKDESGGTALFEAAAGGNLEVVEYLIETANVNVVCENNDGYTAHDWAANEEIEERRKGCRNLHC